MITIQPEKEEDYTAIHEINVLAFGRENEARLVKKIRETPDFIPELSLVAIKKGKVVGHIIFSRITIQSKTGSFPALALAPMVVHPEFQNQAIGSKLVRQGLEHCRNLGFSAAKAKGLEAPFPVPDEVFVILELFPDALIGAKGTVIYPPEFLDV